MAEDLVAKVPPQDLDAEAAVLGAILLLPEAIDQVAQLVKPDQFYSKANGLIYRTLLELNIGGQPIDQVILKGELQSRGLLEDVGGAAYLAELVDSVPTAANAEYYAKVVNEKAILRALISASAEVQGEAFSSPKSTEEVLDWAERKVFEVTQRRVSTAAVPIADAIQEVFDHLKTLREGTDQRGIPSGFAYLDDMTHGFHPGELTILAARPSMGKTSLALSFIRNMSIYDGKAVVFFSLEMPRWQVAANLLCNIGKIDSKHLRGGFLRRDDEDRLIDASELLSSSRIFIDDAPNLSTMELRAKARRLKAQFGIEAIVIDYLQLMTGSGISREGRQVEVSEISRMLKSLARELSVPVIALAQLSRKVEERPDHKPRMSDLRESGCLTGDSEVLLAGGARAPIRELVGREGFRVRALSRDGRGLVEAEVSRAFCTGIKPVFELVLCSGRRIRATANHKFYAEDGWRRLDALKVGERLAVGEGRGQSRGPEASLQLSASSRAASSKNLRNRSGRTDSYSRGEAPSWDEIASIRPAGREEVYDLTVPGPHSFVANGIVVHNSIEQDADVILLLYRAEYYKPEDESVRGLGQIICAKNRNGPTGEMNVSFERQYTRFDNLAPQKE